MTGSRSDRTAPWAILATVLLATWAAAGDDEVALLRRTAGAFTRVAKDAIPAVVFIRVEKYITAPDESDGFYYNDPFGFFGDDFIRRFFGNGYARPRARRFRQEGQGSGFLVTRDGYILTNNHVVGDADRIVVRLSDGREFDARRIGSDPKSEVALIKIDAAGDLPCAPLGDSSKLEIGEWVIAIGNPFGLRETLTVGVVSAKGRSNIGIADYEDFIQTDAAINPGNSGGPLLNIDGEVVGINTAIYSQSGGYMGIGFAIPINMARAIRDQLLAGGRIVRGYLGCRVQELTAELAESFGLTGIRGVLVSDVETGSPAATAGLQPGDIVLKIGDSPVGTEADFRSAVASHPPTAGVAVELLRDGKRTSLKVTMGAAPGESADGADLAAELLDRLGLAIQDLTQPVAARLGYEPGDGVLVAGVEPGGLAWRAGIEPGNLIAAVNRAPVADLAAFKQAVAAARDADVLLLRIRDGRYARYVVVQLK